MAIAIKSLAKGPVPITQTAVYTAAPGKAALVSSMRFVNTNTTTAASVNAFFRRGSGGTPYRILDRDKSVPASQLYLDVGGLSLEPDDRIELVAASGNTVDYVISGVERDQ